MKIVKRILAILLAVIGAFLLLVCFAPNGNPMPTGSTVICAILALACIFGALFLFGVFPAKKPESTSVRASRPYDPDVWITKGGRCYHQSSTCPTLSGSCIKTTLSKAVRQGYKPCGRCNY